MRIVSRFLRDGKSIGTVRTQETNENELAKMMVGRDISEVIKKPVQKDGKEILSLREGQCIWHK